MRARILLAVVFLMAGISAQAQRNLLTKVSLTLNKESGVYAKGETVQVYGALTQPFDSLLTMTVYEGGVRHYRAIQEVPETKTVKLTAQPQVIYEGSFDEAKAVMISVAADKTSSSMVGFMVAPEDFRPGYEMPKDFMAYWKKQKASLRKSKPEVKLTPIPLNSPDDAGYEAFSIEISMPEGNPVRGYLAKPKQAAKRSLPIAMLVHAAGVSGSWCRASLSNALRYAKKGKGVIAIDFNAHGYVEDQPQQYYVDLENGALKNYSTRPLTTRDDFYFRLMYLREVRALDYVCSLPEWDGKRALVYGESQGGGQAEAIAGLDKRITCVVSNVPALTDLGGVRQKRQSGWPPYDREALTPEGEKVLAYFDGAFFLQFSKARLFMVSGFIDETCHAACVQAAYNVAKSKDKQIHTFPYRWHSGTNKPYDKVWNETIGKAREDFINDFLK